MSTKNIKKQPLKKKTSFTKKKDKTLNGKVKALSKKVSTLAKTASPEWLTAPLVQVYSYQSANTMAWFPINQDSGKAIYLGPMVQGSADGQVKSDELEYKYLELNVQIIAGQDALSGIVPTSSAGMLPAGTFSVPGGIDYFFGNRIRMMICYSTGNSLTGNGTGGPSPTLTQMLNTNSYTPSVGNSYLDLIGAYYDEDTGGRRKDHWILYDEVIDMNKLGTINNNLDSDTTAPILGGEYTHRIKLDLKKLPRAKIQTFYNSSGTMWPDLFDKGMLSFHIFSNKCGPTTSSTYAAAHSDRWFCGLTGRLVYTCP